MRITIDIDTLTGATPAAYPAVAPSADSGSDPEPPAELKARAAALNASSAGSAPTDLGFEEATSGQASAGACTFEPDAATVLHTQACGMESGAVDGEGASVGSGFLSGLSSDTTDGGRAAEL